MKTRSFSVRNSLALLPLALLLLTSSALAQTPQATPPPPAAPRSVQFPKPVEKTLPNGLRVILVQRSQMPLITAQVLIKSGGEVDPTDLAGTADMTASLLTRGTTTRSATQIAEAVEALGGSIFSGGGWDSSTVTTGVMSSRIDPAFAILADVVRNPAFKDEEIERLRRQVLNNLRVALGTPGSIARFVAARVVFRDAPYGHPLSGTPESVPRIKRDDIVKLHGTYFRPDNAILVIGGDITPQNGFALAQKYFGDWAKPASTLPNATAESPMSDPNSRRVLVIDKPDAGQTAVLLARTGINRTSPDYFRGIVSNAILSGYSGRLNWEIRVKRGLSYGAGSSFDMRRWSGQFTASVQTKNESGAEVASLTLAEVSGLATRDLPESELTTRKASLLGNFARGMETIGGLVGQVSSLALYGVSLDEINQYVGHVQAVKAEDVKAFASTQLNAGSASLIIVGDSKQFLPALKKDFPQVEVIPVAELDLNSASLRKSASGASKLERQIPLTRLVVGSGSNAWPIVNSGIHERLRQLVSDRETWGGIWKEMVRFGPFDGPSMSSLPLPEIDFSKEMLIVAAMGERPTSGYGIVIEEAYEREHRLEVEVHSWSACGGQFTAVTAPIDIVRVPKTDLPVAFH